MPCEIKSCVQSFAYCLGCNFHHLPELTAVLDVAANLLKPMLARGELRCIGATTLAEHRQHMEKDAAFERRFQQVLVGEPSVQVSTGQYSCSAYTMLGKQYKTCCGMNKCAYHLMLANISCASVPKVCCSELRHCLQ